MFYHLCYQFKAHIHSLNVFRYVSFRTFLAVLFSFTLSVCCTKPLIRFLKKHQKNGQPIREDGPEQHLLKKKGTPTMGGVIIIFSTIISSLFFCNLENLFLWMCISIMLMYGLIGFFDDFKKIKYQNSKGICAKTKFFWQVVCALVCVYGCDYFSPSFIQQSITVPFLKNAIIYLGFFYFLFATFLVVGSSNAVNLTDGLDGLAIGPIIFVCLIYGIISYCTGHAYIARYLHIPWITHSQELCVFLGGLFGSCLGFLWFNAPPAKIMMGDTGSLAIGGVLGLVSLITRQELLLSIVGGVFVCETLSVILQVSSYKMRKKRIFRMAPIHHHFEKKGWSEETIVFRFWIIAILFGIIGLATLKIR